MQFRNIEAQYKALESEIDAGIADVIGSHAFINGSQVRQLETELAAYVGRKHCVTCASGTDALVLPLMAWGIGKGDAVFVPDFTYFASANCAMLRGATPVFVDIDERTFNISVAALERAILETLDHGQLTPRVIIPVDLFGQPAEQENIHNIAKRYGLKVLDDAAQGFGGSIDGKPVGSFGDVAATSFFPAKPLGCYGDGGAIFTDDDEIAIRIRSMRMQGSSPADKYDNISIGLNSRLDTLQAAILLPKFHALIEHELADVNQIAVSYTSKLCELVDTPVILDGYQSSWAQYTILLKNRMQRDALKQTLNDAGIPSMIYYPRGMHQQTAVRAFCGIQKDFPATEDVAARCLSLPMGPYLTDDEQTAVVTTIKRFMETPVSD